MFGLPGGPEIIIIIFVVVLLFGGKKIPELAKGLGKGIREFKEGMKQIDDDDDTKELEKNKTEKTETKED